MIKVKNVKDIIDAIYDDDFNKLPEKIEVAGIIFKKNNEWKNYYSDDGIENCLTSMEGERINRLLDIPVEIIKESNYQKIPYKKIKVKLKSLAEELNDGRKINWKDYNQAKYSIIYDHDDKCISYRASYTSQEPEIIYCLDDDFKKKAIEEIGEENLINYIIGGNTNESTN